MSVYLRGRIYHYEFQFQGVPYRGSTFETDKREAEKVERKERQEVLNGKRNLAGHSVADVFGRYWVKHGKKLKWAPTLSKHMDGLEEHFGSSRRFAEITTKDLSEALEVYAAQTERKNRGGSVRSGSPSDSTVNRRLAVFQQIYRMARDEWELPVGHINFKKLTRREPRVRVRFLADPEQAKALLCCLDEHQEIMRMAAWSLATGCRLNETETLKWSRVYLERRQCEVNTKGGGTRIVELSPDAIAVLALSPQNRVFVFDATNRRKVWEAAVEAAALEDFRWHDMRHHFATTLGDAAGGDLSIVMTALGHSQIGTTMKYRHVVRATVKSGLEKMPTLIEGKVVALTARRIGDAGA